MSRLAEFWKQFLKEIGWTDLPDKGEKLKKRGEFLFWLLGVLGFSIRTAWASWWPWLQPWSEFLLAGIVSFVVWKAAIAWYKTQGAVIWLREFGIDENYLIFELRVANRGSGEVFAHVYAQELRDRKGKIIQRIDPPGIEVHWRGKRAGERMKLYGHRLGSSGVLCIQNCDATTPVLHFATPPYPDDPPGAFRGVPLFPPLPLNQQMPFRLTLCLEFYDVVPSKDSKTTEDQGRYLTSKLVRLLVVPNAKNNRYQIRQLGVFRWWGSSILPTTKPSAG